MTPEPTRTIYNCLGPIFWTSKKCRKCQKQFNISDYQTHNYYLTFKEILNIWATKKIPEPRDNACFEGVIVELFHYHCQLTKSYFNECQIEITQDIIGK